MVGEFYFHFRDHNCTVIGGAHGLKPVPSERLKIRVLGIDLRAHEGVYVYIVQKMAHLDINRHFSMQTLAHIAT